VKCWGDNLAGQLGDGTTVARIVPTDVVGLSSGVVAIGASQLHTCALMSSGAVKCWGDDSLGGLGDGTTGADDCSCRTTPVDVTGFGDTDTPAPPVPTTDVRTTLSTLSSQPSVQALLAAVRDRNVDTLLDLIDWQSVPCDAPHGLGICPTGVAKGADLPMVDTGFGDTFSVTAETLRPALQQVLGGPLLTVSFVGHSADERHRGRVVTPGPRLFLGFEGAARAVEPSVFWGDSTSRTGLFLEINAGAAKPVLEVGFLSEGFDAAAQAQQLQVEGTPP